MDTYLQYYKMLMLKKALRLNDAAYILSLFILFGLTSCAEGKLDQAPTEGHVAIQIAWNGSGLPPTSGFRFYFYPKGGGEVLQYDAAGSGFQGNLPAGTYQVIACSSDARNVTYQGMNDYATASVQALPDASSRSLSYYNQPSGVYSLHLNELIVPLQGSVSTNSIPDTLSRSLNLKFTLQSSQSIVDLTGLMRGVQSSVLISTGKPYGEVGVTAFTADVSGNQGEAQVNVLGILDPSGSLPYRNLMDLTMKLSDNTVNTTQIDLTQTLTEILSTNSGDFPLEVPVEVELRLIDKQLVATVKPWNQSSGEGTVK